MPSGQPVTVLSCGGTIAMAGPQAVPALDAAALIAAVPELAALPGLEARSLHALPGVHVTAADALAVAREAVALARGGRGGVVTHGTDTLEEVAVLTELLHYGDVPVVLTGAIRPASATGADGPANLRDAVAVAASREARGLGVVVVFAGEIHAALDVRKISSVSPRAFGSPRTGPLGFVDEGRVRIERRPDRAPAADVAALDARVPIVPTWLGDDGALLRAALAGADGVVLTTLGAGHVAPAVLDVLAGARVPVAVTVRPEDGRLLHATYGFRGAERDVRATGAHACARLSPQAARIALLVALGAGLAGDALRASLARFDA